MSESLPNCDSVTVVVLPRGLLRTVRTPLVETRWQLVELFGSRLVGYEIVKSDGATSVSWNGKQYDDWTSLKFADQWDGELGDLIIGQGDVSVLAYHLRKSGIKLETREVDVRPLDFSIRDLANLRTRCGNACSEIVVDRKDIARAVGLLTVDGSIDSGENRLPKCLSLVIADDAWVRQSIGAQLSRATLPTVDLVDDYEAISLLRDQVDVEITTSDDGTRTDAKVLGGIAVLCDFRAFDQLMDDACSVNRDIIGLATTTFICGPLQISDVRNLRVLESLPSRSRLYRVAASGCRSRDDDTLSRSLFGGLTHPRIPLIASFGTRLVPPSCRLQTQEKS